MEALPSNNDHKILIKDKKGCYVLNPLKSKEEKIFSYPECNLVVPSKNYIAIINKGLLSLLKSKDLTLLKEFTDLELVTNVDFSPKEKYLTIIQKPSIQNNLKIINLTNNNYEVFYLFSSQINPMTQWPQITYDPKEEVIFKHIKTTIEIYKIYSEEKKSELLGTLDNIIGYEKCEYPNSKNEIETMLIVGKIVQQEKNKKCLFSCYNLNNLDKPLKEMYMSLTDRMKLKISKDNKYILIHSMNDNTSSSSYYGNSTLYFSDLETLKFTKFNLPQGPIHDFDWCNDGERFIICAGHLPSQVTIYEKNNKFIKELCIGKFNKLYISPDSRIVALCGFGSLNGDIEFYSLVNYQLIGKYNFFCCVGFHWSFDSKYVLGSVLSTRVKVDNEYRIIKYNGEEVMNDKKVGEIYDCFWIYDEGCQNELFDIQVNTKSLEEKKKSGVILTSTLGTINFSNSNKKNEEKEEQGPIIGVKKKKKKNKKK